MKRCLHCETTFAGNGWTCPRCGFQPPENNGFLIFALTLSMENDGFSADSHASLDHLQASSFWFRARNKLIRDLAGRFFPSAQSIMEVGCGTGYVLEALQEALPEAQLTGSEIYTEALVYAQRRARADIKLLQMDARRLPFQAEFDLICAFDVLEHIDEDHLALTEFRRALTPGGGLLLSVPQHPSLWSRVDEAAYHKRRYRRRELEDKCRAAGFDVVFSTSFVCSLLPLMALQRLRHRRDSDYDGSSDFALPAIVDRTFEAALNLERRLIRLGLRFPVGGSRFVVARRSPQM